MEKSLSYRAVLGTPSLLGLIAALVLSTTESHACGVSGPEGASLCAIAEGAGPKWRLSFAGSTTWTRIHWSNDLNVDQTRGAGLVFLGYAASPRLLFQGGLGASYGGSTRMPDGPHSFNPGGLATFGVSYRIYGGPTASEKGEAVDRNPFIVLSAQLSMNATTTQVGLDASTNTRYLAFDLRLGAAVGVTLFERFRPYALARIFGGPIFWSYRGESLTGTDLYKYQLGGGASVSIANGVSVFAEGVFLGETGASGGLGFAF
ncbi:MAG: hypothetical protein KBF88_03660 [Polyangiaceae bacterium]|nr:hypothetical protein [Polyangiaceae bacterium]